MIIVVLDLSFTFCQKNVLECFKKVEVESHRFTGNDIIILKSDNGGEYVKTDFKVFFEKSSIRHE
jgi:hypothetical protein